MAGKGGDASSNVSQMIEESDFATAARRWRLCTCARTAKDYLSGAGAEEAVSSRESGGPGAAAHLLPPTKPQHRFTDQAFVTSVRLRMRLPVYMNDGPCTHRSKRRPGHPPQSCPVQRDRYGLHCLCCKVGGHVMTRHNAVRDRLAAITGECLNTIVYTEQNGNVSEDERRPDFHYANAKGMTEHADVRIATPHARTTGGDTRCGRPGAVIAAAEHTKRRKYAALCLTPAVWSHLGRPGDDVVTFIHGLCNDADLSARSKTITAIWQDLAGRGLHHPAAQRAHPLYRRAFMPTVFRCSSSATPPSTTSALSESAALVKS